MNNNRYMYAKHNVCEQFARHMNNNACVALNCCCGFFVLLFFLFFFFFCIEHLSSCSINTNRKFTATLSACQFKSLYYM